jgi:hypothetical protein
MKTKVLFVSGLPRCATTAFASVLCQHPEITEPAQKEPHFFLPEVLKAKGYALKDSGDVKPFTRLGFSLTKHEYWRNLRAKHQATFLLDGSTLYSAHEGSFSSIAHAKDIEPFFFLLKRDPLKRAVSHYLFSRSRGEEYRTFMDALRDEQQGQHRNWILGGYLRGSKLYPAVEEILREFGQSRLKVVDIESTSIFSQQTMNRITQVLGISPYEFNFGVYPNKVPDLTGRYGRQLRIMARKARQINPLLVDNKLTRRIFEATLRRFAGPQNSEQTEILVSQGWQEAFAEVRSRNDSIVSANQLLLCA